jgi:hypothetical protein
MALADILFKGVPRRFTRGYTSEVIEAEAPSKVVIPCVGAFALASTVVQSGVRPESVEACDISLYSSVIGMYLAGRDLKVRAVGRWEWLNQYMEDPQGKVAGVSLAIRILQYEAGRQNLYKRERIRELVERQEVYIQQLRRRAEQMHSMLAGIDYRPMDMWELLAKHFPDPQTGEVPEGADPGSTLVLANPPRYEAGYSKMYAGVDDAFRWEAPNVKQFGEDQYVPLMRYMGHEKAPHTLVYYATPVGSSEDPAELWGSPWRSVFAARPKTGRQAAINWIVANREAKTGKKLQRSDVEGTVRGKYKLFREGVISAESDMRVQVESKEVASYYRDLLVHNLGMANAERYKVLLIDGKLVATIGLHLQNLRAGGSMQGVAKLRFAFSVDHPEYDKLHKLTLLSIISSWFWEGELGDIEPPPRAVQTTMLTPYPEVKTARGIFKLRGREKDKDSGMNRLTYYADVVDRTAKETIEEFLRRWGPGS